MHLTCYYVSHVIKKLHVSHLLRDTCHHYRLGCWVGGIFSNLIYNNDMCLLASDKHVFFFFFIILCMYHFTNNNM
jgi:hypothetical protein